MADDLVPSYPRLWPVSPTRAQGADKASGAELIACAWAIRKGWHAFRSENKNGPIDVVFVNRWTGEVILIDVKTITTAPAKVSRITGKIKWYVSVARSELSTEQERLNVRLLFVTPNGYCTFDRAKALDVAAKEVAELNQ